MNTKKKRRTKLEIEAQELRNALETAAGNDFGDKAFIITGDVDGYAIITGRYCDSASYVITHHLLNTILPDLVQTNRRIAKRNDNTIEVTKHSLYAAVISIVPNRIDIINQILTNLETT